ncbi:MAG TPA: alpha/beta fold hydrolase [Dehalococcoidia bacterium]|nr:alpha/beta fold hydrolase [Dehalococcoidia bacterium]
MGDLRDASATPAPENAAAGRDQLLEERRIALGGLSLEYRVGGEGHPIVLVHGDLDSALAWRWVAPALTATHRVYAPSLPGYGGSSKPAADYSPGYLAGALAAFLDALAIDRPILIGHSLGGLVALRVALADPTRLGALALIASAGLGRAIHPIFLWESLPGVGEAVNLWSRTPIGAVQRVTNFARLAFWRADGVPQTWFDDKYRLLLQPGFLEASLAARRSQITWFGQREVLLDRLTALDLPVLIVWGAEDRVLPPVQARLAAARLHRGRLVLLPGCGHLPIVEHPDRVVACLGEFLDEAA